MHISVSARHVVIALAGILIGVVLSGAAHAIVESTYRYSTPQTGYLMVPAPAFVPQTNTVAYSNGAALHASTFSCFYAPVSLPQGARMSQLTTWYIKNGTTGGAEAQLQSLSPLNPAFLTAVATVLLNNTSGAVKQASVDVTDPSVQTVNNAHLVYRIILCLSGEESFVSARIGYTYKSAGD